MKRRTCDKRPTMARALRVLLGADIFSSRFLAAGIAVFMALLGFADRVGALSAVDSFTFPFQLNNAIHLTCLAAGLCTGTMFFEERVTGFRMCEIARIGTRRYYAARFASSSIATGLAMAAGYALYAAYCLASTGEVVFSDELSRPGLFGAFDSLLGSNPAAWFAVVIACQFFVGAVVGALGVMWSSIARGKYIGVVLPYLSLFFWSQVAMQLGLPAWAQFMPVAKCLFSFGGLSQTFALYLAMFFALIAMAFALYWGRVLKGGENHG